MLRSRRLKTPILQGFLSVKIAKTVFYTFILKNGLLLRNTAIENWITATLTVAPTKQETLKGLPAFSFAKIRKENLCRKTHRQSLRPPPPRSRRPSSEKSARPPMNYRSISVRQAQSAWAIKSCGYWKMTYPQRNDENFSLCPWQTDRKGSFLLYRIRERRRFAFDATIFWKEANEERIIRNSRATFVPNKGGQCSKNHRKQVLI